MNALYLIKKSDKGKRETSPKKVYPKEEKYYSLRR